jgi:DNA-binding MarR family transcriptional regulator
MSTSHRADRDTIIASIATYGREQSRLSVLFRELVARHFGISAADAECVDFLMEAGAATAGDLVRLTGLTPGAITGVIRRLTRAGLVTTEADVHDRRKVVVRPVMEGVLKGLRFYTSYANAVHEQVYAHYSPDELAIIADYHRRMSAVLAEEIKKVTSGRGADSDTPMTEGRGAASPPLLSHDRP